ncbi:MAG: hypothetical protein WAS21_08580 [Geminicoccaceae bacterium]
MQPLGREPHCVIGSCCIGASVLGGICNNSGGSLIQRGPAFTQLALYAHVRDIDAETPARFNADPRRLSEASGSAGKLMLLAVRLDTFAQQSDTKSFYIGTDEPAELTAIRRHMLAYFEHLPVSAEYLHRHAFDIAANYGKYMFLAIQYLSTDHLPALFSIKARIDAMAARIGFLPKSLSDRLLQRPSGLFSNHLPKPMIAYREWYAHHLLLKIAGTGIAPTRDYRRSTLPSSGGDFFEYTAEKGGKAFLHRFAAAALPCAIAPSIATRSRTSWP